MDMRINAEDEIEKQNEKYIIELLARETRFEFATIPWEVCIA